MVTASHHRAAQLARLGVAFLAAVVVPPPARAAASASSPLVPGTYVLEDDSGTLNLREENGRLLFEVQTVGANCHTCSLSGSVKGLSGVAGEGETRCLISFSPAGSTVSVAPTTPEQCQGYCGMRASFDGKYQIPPEHCTAGAQQKSRNEFAQLYRAKQFAPARKILEGLTSECGPFINWVTIDRVRNDLALAQFHDGDIAACAATLRETWAARYENEEALKGEMAPCDFDLYLDVARSTWHNLRLCGSATAPAPPRE